ncbi:hypothetical protein BH10PSE17_BH10PSE17_29580 [soil metagenome]
MFSNKKKHPMVASKLSSLIAEGVEITGDLVFTGGMRIDGKVKGNVVGRDTSGGKTPPLLVLSDKGQVEGSVRCGNALINGVVTGDLDIEHFLELQSSARVHGTIRYRQLQMDVGADVQGRLVRADVPATNVVELPVEKAERS